MLELWRSIFFLSEFIYCRKWWNPYQTGNTSIIWLFEDIFSKNVWQKFEDQKNVFFKNIFLSKYISLKFIKIKFHDNPATHFVSRLPLYALGNLQKMKLFVTYSDGSNHMSSSSTEDSQKSYYVMSSCSSKMPLWGDHYQCTNWSAVCPYTSCCWTGR